MSESNNYERTVWATGDLITADKMNNSEKQIDNVTNALNIGNGCQCLYLTPGYSYRTINGKLEKDMYKSPTFNDGGTVKVACKEGDIFVINGTGASTSRLWVFTDFSEETILRTAATNATASNLILKAPKNSSFLVINSTTNMLSFKGLTPYVSDELLKTSAQSASLVPLDFLPDGVSLIQTTKFGYINPRVNPIDLNPTSSEVMEHAVVECAPGEQFYLNVRGAASGRAYAFADTNLAPLTDTIAASDTEYHGILTAPENAAYLIINNRLDPDSVFFHSYKGAIEDATSKFGMWNGYFRQCININTVDQQIEIPAQRIIIGNKQIDVPETQLQYDYSKVYINLYYDRLSKGFKILNSKNDTPPLGYYFMGVWRKGQEEHAAINGSFAVNGKENYEDIIDNKISDFNDSLTANMILPGQEDMGWIGNWIRPEVVSFKGVRDKIYWAFTAKSGAKGIAEYDFDSGRIIKRNLHKLRTRDLHNDLAIHIFDNGIILCAYSTGHNTDKNVRIRKSLYPENIECFTDELVLPCEGATTYAQLVESSGKLYLFYRNSVLKWAYRYSTDNGDTWSDEVNLIVSDAQYYCVFEKTTNADVLRVIMYTNPQLPELLDTNFRQAFFHTDTNTLYNSDNTTVLGQSDVDKNNITILVPNDENLPNQRLLDVAISDIDRPLLVYAPFTPPASGGVYRIFDSGVTHDIVACGAVLLSNTPYYLGAKFIDTTQMIVFHGSGAEGGIDIGTIYNYDGTNVTPVKDIYNEHRGSENIRNFYPIIDANKKVIMWLRGIYGKSYREFQTNAMIYSINDDRIVPISYSQISTEMNDLKNNLETEKLERREAIYNAKNAIGSIIDFSKQNILDESFEDGAILNDGTDGTNINYLRTDYQPILSNKSLYFVRENQPYQAKIYFYTISKEFISSAQIFSANTAVLVSNGTIISPENAAYFRLQLPNPMNGGIMLSYTYVGEYHPTTYYNNIKLANEIININNLDSQLRNIAEQAPINNEIINDLTTFTSSENFFDGTFPILKKYLETDGSEATGVNNCATDFIAVDSSKSTLYFLRSNQPYLLNIVFYNANKEAIMNTSTSARSAVYSAATTDLRAVKAIPENAAFFRMYTVTANYSGTLAISYEELDEYVEYEQKYTLANESVRINNLSKTLRDSINAKASQRLYGKNIAFMGDSVIGNFYDNAGESIGICNIIEQKTGAKVINCAFGGTRMAYRYSTSDTYSDWNKLSGVELAKSIAKTKTMDVEEAFSEQTAAATALASGITAYFTDRINSIKAIDWEKIDFILWEYGTNDFSTNVALNGNALNTYAFIPMYQTAIQTILEAYPHIQIILITPTWRWYRDDNTGEYLESGDTHKEKDYLGNWSTLPDFVNAIFEIANDNHLQVIDNYYALGANPYTYLEYFKSTDGVHPNANGRIRIAQRIIDTINSGESTLLPQKAEEKTKQFINKWYNENFPGGENIIPNASVRIYQRGIIYTSYDFTKGADHSILLMPTLNGNIKQANIFFDRPDIVDIIGVQSINIIMYISNRANISTAQFRIRTNNVTLDYGITNKITEGWNNISININTQTYENIASWGAADSFRLYFTGANTNDFEIYISSISLNRSSKANLIFVDDHAYHGFKEKAYPLLKAAGQPVTWAINPGDLGGQVADGESKLTQEDIDELAYDAYSEFSFHNWNPKNNPTETMTPDQLREDYQKCITYLKVHGICPTHLWRAALTQNRANNWWVANEFVEAAAMHNASGGFVTWPFDDPYNVQRVSLHRGKINDAYEDFETQFKPRIDEYFDRLQKTHGTMILYTHGCIDNRLTATSDLHCTVEEIQYLCTKIEQGINDGWLNPTTYNRLRMAEYTNRN